MKLTFASSRRSLTSSSLVSPLFLFLASCGQQNQFKILRKFSAWFSTKNSTQILLKGSALHLPEDNHGDVVKGLSWGGLGSLGFCSGLGRFYTHFILTLSCATSCNAFLHTPSLDEIYFWSFASVLVSVGIGRRGYWSASACDALERTLIRF